MSAENSILRVFCFQWVFITHFSIPILSMELNFMAMLQIVIWTKFIFYKSLLFVSFSNPPTQSCFIIFSGNKNYANRFGIQI